MIFYKFKETLANFMHWFLLTKIISYSCTFGNIMHARCESAVFNAYIDT